MTTTLTRETGDEHQLSGDHGGWKKQDLSGLKEQGSGGSSPCGQHLFRPGLRQENSAHMIWIRVFGVFLRAPGV